MKGAAGLALAAGIATTVTSVTPGAPVRVTAPLTCTRGPSGQTFAAVVAMPSSRPSGAQLEVRIDGVPSGKISHTGLNYIHDMTTTYLIPAGTEYVEGSAHLVPGSGTANVRTGAHVWHAQGVVHLLLPAHVENGSSYTPPSLAFDVEITAPAGAAVSLKLDRYEVTANAFLVGDLLTICEPRPKPYTLFVTRVDARPSL